MGSQQPSDPTSAILSDLRSTFFVGLLCDSSFKAHYSINIADPEFIDPSSLGVNLDSFSDAAMISNFENMAGRIPLLWKPANLLQAMHNFGDGAKLCSFFPVPWLDDLLALGYDVFNVSYTLFLRLDNKIRQFDLLSELGPPDLQDNIRQRFNLFGTRFIEPNKLSYYELKKEYGDFINVIRTSSGGSGVFYTSNFREFALAVDAATGPTIRVERYRSSVPLTQLGICFRDTTLHYPVQPQFIRLNQNRLQYAGVTCPTPTRVPEHIQQKAAKLTQSCGAAIEKLGFRGAFGCDFVYVPEDDDVFLMELNPRFVGETHFFSMCAKNSQQFSNDISQQIFLDPHVLHLAAFHVSHPSELSLDVYTREGQVRIDPMTHMPYDTIIPFDLHAATRNAGNRPTDFDRSPMRICLLLRDFTSDSLRATQPFPPEIETVWREVHA